MSGTTNNDLRLDSSRHDTDLSNSTHSSRSSADRYALDEVDSSPILLYKYRGSLQTSSQKDLCAWLDKDETLRVTKMKIPRYSSYVDVKRHDLFMPGEKEQYSRLPNYDSSVASIKVPSTAYWSNVFLGRYNSLYIVSPESSPNSSIADSESGRPSPTSTWGHNSEEDAAATAAQEAQRDRAA